MNKIGTDSFTYADFALLKFVNRS